MRNSAKSRVDLWIFMHAHFHRIWTNNNRSFSPSKVLLRRILQRFKKCFRNEICISFKLTNLKVENFDYEIWNQRWAFYFYQKGLTKHSIKVKTYLFHNISQRGSADIGIWECQDWPGRKFHFPCICARHTSCNPCSPLKTGEDLELPLFKANFQEKQKGRRVSQ